MNEIYAIFDWDGVIVDSSSQHEKSWDLLAQEEGLKLPEGHFKKGFGMKNELIIPNVLNWTVDRNEITRLSLRKEELYRKIVTESGIDALPGIKSFLEMLKLSGIKCAIGSSSHRANIQAVMPKIGIADYFDVIITGEDVTASKPDPQCFLLAAQELSASPENCVVFEDAPAGILAAHSARMKAVGLATTHPAYELTDADIVVRTIEEINLSNLEDLFRFESIQSY